MLAVVAIVFATIVLALFLAALLPGVGLFAAAAVVLIGIALTIWLVAAGASRTTPTEAVGEVEERELLGPGGPDDPR